MHTRGRTLKFTAVLALVVLALTGFSTGRHGRGSGGGSGDGGGCSSSSQNHGSSSTTSGGSSGSYDSDDDYSGSDNSGGDYSGDEDSPYGDSYGSSTSTSGGSGGGYATRRPGYRSTPTSSSSGSGTALRDGTAKLVSCATATTPYATVEITNPNQREADFQAWVTFYDAQGTELLRNISVTVTVPAQSSAHTQVKLGKRFLASVDHCEADPEADLAD